MASAKQQPAPRGAGSRGHTNLLKQYGLSRNPYTDRTAEKTILDDTSLYMHSDLQGFRPSETTYIFFGRRGSGKTTIRMQMMRAYSEYNDAARASGKTRGHFVVDLSRPGHLTGCLRQFQSSIGATDDNWDAAFENWTSADMVDCIVSYAITHLVDELTDVQSVEGMDMLERLRLDPRASKQFLLLAHLYANTDASSLAFLRRSLLGPSITVPQGVIAGSATVAVAGAAAYAAKDPSVAAALSRPLDAAAAELERSVPLVAEYPRLSLAAAGVAVSAGVWWYRRYSWQRSLRRAAAVSSVIRVVKQQPTETLAALLNALFATADTAETIRSLCVGVSGHQKLEHLARLLHLLGYESLAVFGDCFDEVVLLDPVQYPSAIKVFAREVCRNDILNFGRMHWFFPDSRLSLDLSTDKTLKEARFDRHFVRDLTWSRHQLEELAERRFLAAQLEQQRRAMGSHPVLPTSAAAADGANGGQLQPKYTFADLFKAVNMEDFSSYISKLSTPRELMIMMTEMMARMEAHPDGGLTGQDMEISCTRALEQAV